MNPIINKFGIAAATALSVIVLGLTDGHMTNVEWIQAAISALGAFGVYAIPNSPPRRPRS